MVNCGHWLIHGCGQCLSSVNRLVFSVVAAPTLIIYFNANEVQAEGQPTICFSSSISVKHAARWADTPAVNMGYILRPCFVLFLHINHDSFFLFFSFGEKKQQFNLYIFVIFKHYNSLPSFQINKRKEDPFPTERNVKQEDVLRNAPGFNPLKRGIAAIFELHFNFLFISLSEALGTLKGFKCPSVPVSFSHCLWFIDLIFSLRGKGGEIPKGEKTPSWHGGG